MKKVFQKILFFLTLIVVYNGVSQVANYNVGDIVDDFTVTDLNGNNWNLYNLTSQGKFVYLDFFFTTCVPCRTTQSIFNEVYDKYGCNSGDLIMISINNGSDTNSEIISFMDEYGGPFNHAPAVGIEGGCEAVDANFGIIGYPSYVLINADNIFLGRLEGYVNDITVEAFEDSFPAGFNPEPMPCSLGLANNNSAFDFEMFPNPSNGGFITLIANNFYTNAEVVIYNLLGQAVYSQAINQAASLLEINLLAGNYIIQLTTKEERYTKKLLVK